MVDDETVLTIMNNCGYNFNDVFGDCKYFNKGDRIIPYNEAEAIIDAAFDNYENNIKGY